MTACGGSRVLSPLILNLFTSWRWMVIRLSRLLLWSVVPRILLNSVEHSSSYTSRFNTQKFYVSSTQCICVCLYGSETSVVHFPVHLWLILVTDAACLLCGTTWIFTHISGLFSFFKEAIPWLRRWVAGLSPQRPRFDARSVPLLFVVDKVALGQGFLRVLRLSLVSIIPPVFHTHLYLYAVLPGQTDEVWEPSKKAEVFWKSGSIG